MPTPDEVERTKFWMHRKLTSEEVERIRRREDSKSHLRPLSGDELATLSPTNQDFFRKRYSGQVTWCCDKKECVCGQDLRFIDGELRYLGVKSRTLVEEYAFSRNSLGGHPNTLAVVLYSLLSTIFAIIGVLFPARGVRLLFRRLAEKFSELAQRPS